MRVLISLCFCCCLLVLPCSVTAWSLPGRRGARPFEPPSLLVSSFRHSITPPSLLTTNKRRILVGGCPTRKLSPLFQSSSSSSSLATEDNSDDSSVEIAPLVKAASKRLQRLSWFSWWSQMILTTISTTILVFAASVVRTGGRNAAAAGNVASAPSFFLSAVAVLVSAVSILWTWGNGARLSRRLLRATSAVPATQHIQAARLVRRAVQVQVSINLLGLFLTLLAAEEIVGSLAIKVLTTFGVGAGATIYNAPLMGLQPLDILVVQANTNTLLAQFISLATSLALTDQIRALDPPSTLEEPRKRK